MANTPSNDKNKLSINEGLVPESIIQDPAPVQAGVNAELVEGRFSEHKNMPALHDVEDCLHEDLSEEWKVGDPEALTEKESAFDNADFMRKDALSNDQQSPNYADGSLSFGAVQTLDNWGSTAKVAAGFCGVAVCLGVLSVFGYRLYSENLELRKTVVALETQITRVEPLYLTTSNRVDRLVVSVHEINAAIKQINDQNTALFVNGQADYLPNDMVALSNLTVALQKKIDTMQGQSIHAEPNEKLTQPDAIAPAIVKEPIKIQPVLKQASTKQQEIKKTGKWIVNLVSFRNQRNADSLQKKIRAKSIPVEKQTIKLNGKPMYRLRVKGFQTKKEADRYGSNAIQKLKLKSYWITT